MSPDAKAEASRTSWTAPLPTFSSNAALLWRTGFEQRVEAESHGRPLVSSGLGLHGVDSGHGALTGTDSFEDGPVVVACVHRVITVVAMLFLGMTCSVQLQGGR